MRIMVLNSGGVDSTTCVGLAVKEVGKENVCTVSVVYGQKHSKELNSAVKVAEYYNLKNYLLDLTEIFKYSNCSLLVHSTDRVPKKSYKNQMIDVGDGRVSTYVPFRNGLMLAAVTSLADSLYPGEAVKICYGAHADDSTGNAYADCSEEFAKSLDMAINLGTYGNISVYRPLINMNKSDVVKLGLQLGVPYELTWSCYEGLDKPCGTCGTCIDRIQAFKNNGIELE